MVYLSIADAVKYNLHGIMKLPGNHGNFILSFATAIWPGYPTTKSEATMIKKIRISVAVILITVLAVMTARTLRVESRQLRTDITPGITIDGNRAAQNLSRALTFRTIAHGDPSRTEPAEFLRFHRFIKERYPRLSAGLRREKINRLNLLYTWKGSDPALKPILLMAHMDVVPADGTTLTKWTHPPFSGHNDGTFIWGRGALDMKSTLVAILESVEFLLGQGFRPRRTVYIALGCDEEQGGRQGIKLVTELLASRNVSLDMVLDEGGSIVRGMIWFLQAPVALIGIAEKGYLTLELVVESHGGHSSMPPRETPAGILCAAIARLEAGQFPLRPGGVTGRMLEYLAPESTPAMRFVLTNLWLFGPLVRWQMAADPSSAASLRTTIAPTMLQGSDRENVLPSRARATVNFRIIPGETAESVTAEVRRIIGDERVKIFTAGSPSEPSPISSISSKEFQELRKTIGQVFPGAVSAPYLVLGATDSRYFRGISASIFRFSPIVLTKDDLKGIHGIDEKISVDTLKRAVEFYARLIRNMN